MTYGYGYVNVRRAQELGIHGCTVFVNGVETKDCFAFNDEEGWADIYTRDRDGRILTFLNETCPLRIFGKITIARKKDG